MQTPLRRLLLAGLAAAASSTLLPALAADAVTAGDATVSLSGGKKKLGGKATLEVTADSNAVVAFGDDFLSPSWTSGEIDHAVLRLFVTKVKKGGPVRVRSVLGAFDEKTVSGNDAPIVDTTTHHELIVSPDEQGQWVYLDVTAFVQDWLDGNSNGVLALTALGDDTDVRFASREAANGVRSPALSVTLSQGPVGPAGSVGPQGETGPAGPQGDIGPAGATGPQGDTGPAGPQGDAGPAGSEGPQGDTGPAGLQGDTGPAGPQGDAGPTGDTGPQGDEGPTGAQGAQGDAGPTGATGPAGPSSAIAIDALGSGVDPIGDGTPLAFVRAIPDGFELDEVLVHGEDATVDVEIFAVDMTTGTLTSLGTGDVGTAITFSARAFTDQEYVLVRVDAVDGDDTIFGVEYTSSVGSASNAFDDDTDLDIDSSSDGEWDVDASPASVVGALPYVSAPSSLNYNDGTSYGGAFGPGTDGTAAWDVDVDVSGTATAEVSFACNYETRDTGPDGDDKREFIVRDVLDNPLLTAQLGTTSSVNIDACAAMGTWHTHTLTLDPAWGTINVAFDFGSDASSSTGNAGWFIDDLAIAVRRRLWSTPAHARVGVVDDS